MLDGGSLGTVFGRENIFLVIIGIFFECIGEKFLVNNIFFFKMILG